MEILNNQNKSLKLLVPLPVERAIAKLGRDLGLARRRRHTTQASLAERIGASPSTVRRMEQGDQRVPLHFFARALHTFGEIERLANLLDTAQDEVGLTPALALTALANAIKSVSDWRTAAGHAAVGLHSHELDDFAPAFEHEQMDAARKLLR